MIRTILLVASLGLSIPAISDTSEDQKPSKSPVTKENQSNKNPSLQIQKDPKTLPSVNPELIQRLPKLVIDLCPPEGCPEM